MSEKDWRPPTKKWLEMHENEIQAMMKRLSELEDRIIKLERRRTAHG